ncbi:MAG: hypothetical protein ACOX3T_03055 [Bdellovibrionota bacterium]
MTNKNEGILNTDELVFIDVNKVPSVAKARGIGPDKVSEIKVDPDSAMAVAALRIYLEFGNFQDVEVVDFNLLVNLHFLEKNAKGK